MKRSKKSRIRHDRRGAALVFAAIAALVIAAMGMSMLAMNLSTEKLLVTDRREQKAFYAAEAGLSEAMVLMSNDQLNADFGQPGIWGTEAAPIPIGKSAYWVVVEALDSRSYTITSTAMDDTTRERLQIVLAEQPSGLFQFAAFGDDGVVLDSNAFIDSYDSALGDYDSQVQGGNEWARENGDVGSNADIYLNSNTEVHGDATPGPGHFTDDYSRPGAYVSGSTDPALEEFPLPPIEVPVIPSSGTIVGKQQVVVGPGDVHYDSIALDGGSTLTVVGPATFVVDDLLMKSNTKLIFDTANGPVDLYASSDFVLESNSTVVTSSNSALDVTLLLAGDNRTKRPPDTLKLGSNSDFVGAIYAPYSEFSLSSNFTIYGSIMCGFLDLSSFGEIHYDEALMYDGFGSTDDYEQVLWRPLPVQ